ncbi:MAG: DUF885 domain-containing protein [Thalassotalea sp.]|nr:DUF885 domain-containing protein [Thalassotalea sp.]
MIKTFFKRLFITLLVVITIGAGFAVHEWKAEKPFVFRVFLDRTLIQFAFESPETLTSLGFLESLGFKDHNGKLDDNSPERADELYEKLPALKATLLSYDDASLSESDQLSKEIALYLLEYGEQSKPYRYHNYPVNQLFGVQSDFPSFMEAQHQVHTLEDAEHYLQRLEAVRVKFAQNLAGIQLRAEKCILPPRFVIDRVLEEMHNFVSTPAKENILFTSLATKLNKIDELSRADKSRILASAESNINSYVYPAYDLFIEYFERIKTRAGNNHGLWHLPDGDKAYNSALKFFTTTDFSADEIHNIGLSEVERIQDEIMSILAEQGFDTGLGFSHAIELLAADERFYYADTDQGRADILKDYQKILDEIDLGLDNAFRIRPKAGMEVVRIPEFKEKTSPGAYYEQPSLDGTRPGRFFANLYDIKATPKYGMRTLAYHEGIPGHHFQVAITMELEGLPFLRRMSPFTAYTEGWALYAEYLAWELGFQDDPFNNIGRLQAELFRAVRLVVDTGIHAKRWTREEAIDYMKANTGMAQSDVVAEIERYIVMPGQATAYKVGMMKILSLRQRAQDVLGDRFDLRDFHDVVLKNGAVPLDILEQLVEKYIENT